MQKASVGSTGCDTAPGVGTSGLRGAPNGPLDAPSVDLREPGAYLRQMITFAPLCRFRIHAGSLLTRFLPRAGA